MALNERITQWRGRRVWLVGASTGIGAALARALSAQGAQLALSARRQDKLERLAADCPGSVLLPLDVTVSGSLQQALDALLAQWHGVDLVILNAGTYRPLHIEDLSPEASRETINLNLLGVMDGVSAVAPTLLRQGTGGVVIVGSVAGYAGLPKALAYGASKAGLINFAESLYLELAPRGVSVYLVNPGFVATPLTEQNDFHMPALMQPEEASAAILAGLARGDFEIHFPKRFTLWLKLLRLLPYRWFFPLVRRATGGRG